MRLMPRFLVGGMCQTRAVVESREDRDSEFPDAHYTADGAPCGVPGLGEGPNIVELAVLGTAMRVGRHGEALTKRATGRRRKAP